MTCLVWEVKRTKQIVPISPKGGGRGPLGGGRVGYLPGLCATHFGGFGSLTACFQLPDLSVCANMYMCEHA